MANAMASVKVRLGSTLTESQIKERIATMQSMISDHKKELFASESAIQKGGLLRT